MKVMRAYTDFLRLLHSSFVPCLFKCTSSSYRLSILEPCFVKLSLKQTLIFSDLENFDCIKLLRAIILLDRGCSSQGIKRDVL